MNQLLDLILHPLAEILGGFARIIQGAFGLWALWVFLGIPLWVLWQGIVHRSLKCFLLALIAFSPMIVFFMLPNSSPAKRIPVAAAQHSRQNADKDSDSDTED